MGDVRDFPLTTILQSRSPLKLEVGLLCVGTFFSIFYQCTTYSIFMKHLTSRMDAMDSLDGILCLTFSTACQGLQIEVRVPFPPTRSC